MFMGTEPRSVTKTVRSMGPIRSIRRPPNRLALSAITLPLIQPALPDPMSTALAVFAVLGEGIS